MKKKTLFERRRASRIQIPLAISYKLKGESADFRCAFCNNISGTGFCLLLTQPVKEGDLLEICVKDKGSSYSVKATCRVCWVMEKNKGEFITGLKFVKIIDPCRFTEFLCGKMLDLYAQK